MASKRALGHAGSVKKARQKISRFGGVIAGDPGDALAPLVEL